MQEVHGNEGKSRRVLVVEDNLDAVRSLVALLRQMGHEVQFAINGYAGIETARSYRPDVVFLDLGLPGMDGFEVCRRLRNDPGLQATRVIALTAYGQEQYRDRALEAGCELHVPKPISPARLTSLLR